MIVNHIVKCWFNEQHLSRIDLTNILPLGDIPAKFQHDWMRIAHVGVITGLVGHDNKLAY